MSHPEQVSKQHVSLTTPRHDYTTSELVKKAFAYIKQAVSMDQESRRLTLQTFTAFASHHVCTSGRTANAGASRMWKSEAMHFSACTIAG